MKATIRKVTSKITGGFSYVCIETINSFEVVGTVKFVTETVSKEIIKCDKSEMLKTGFSESIVIVIDGIEYHAEHSLKITRTPQVHLTRKVDHRKFKLSGGQLRDTGKFETDKWYKF